MTPSPGGSPRYNLPEKNLERTNIFFLQGAPAEKLTVGMPTFGHGWELMDENEVSSQDKIKKTISPEWSVLLDSGEQSERTIHWPIRLPRLLRDHAGPQQ